MAYFELLLYCWCWLSLWDWCWFEFECSLPFEFWCCCVHFQSITYATIDELLNSAGPFVRSSVEGVAHVAGSVVLVYCGYLCLSCCWIVGFEELFVQLLLPTECSLVFFFFVWSSIVDVVWLDVWFAEVLFFCSKLLCCLLFWGVLLDDLVPVCYAYARILIFCCFCLWAPVGLLLLWGWAWVVSSCYLIAWFELLSADAAVLVMLMVFACCLTPLQVELLLCILACLELLLLRFLMMRESPLQVVVLTWPAWVTWTVILY